VIAILSLIAGLTFLYDPFGFFEEQGDSQDGSGSKPPDAGSLQSVDGEQALSYYAPSSTDCVQELGCSTPPSTHGTRALSLDAPRTVGDVRIASLSASQPVSGVLTRSISVPQRGNGTSKVEQTTRIPILMYHHFADEGDPGTVISAEAFGLHIRALRDAGYNAITFKDLCAFVDSGVPLPAKAILITIDDGYLSVYETAFPILRKYGMNATVFIVGVTHGASIYKDTDYRITPHFNDAQALKMVRSGVISVQSHSYDMHQYEPMETGRYRTGILRMVDESIEDYTAAFTADYERAASQIEDMLGQRPFVYAYPFGYYSELSEVLLAGLGVRVTLTTIPGVSTVVMGSPESLFALNRFNIPGDMTADELLELIGNYS